MSKKLSPLEAWEQVKEYIEFSLGYKNSCEAIRYTSTYGYLKPFIDEVETALEEKEELYERHLKTLNELNNWKSAWHLQKYELKALEIIKEKQVDVGALYELDLELYNKYAIEINGTLTLTQEEYDLLKEVLL